MRASKGKHDLKNVALYGGIEKEEYQSILPDIHRKNSETLRLAAGMCALMFLALLLGSFFSGALAEARSFYGAMLFTCGGIYLLTFTPCMKGRRLVLVLWYLLFFAFGTYAVTLNTFIHPDLSAVTLCVFLVAGPLIIIECPWRVIGFQLVLSVEYILCAVRTKTPYVAFADSVNVACCVFLGAAIYIRLNRVKLREAIQARLLQQERDTDKLTGLLNKAAIQDRIRGLLSQPQQRGAMVVMDIDHFKHINDSYGHAYGDLVLRRVADCICETVPEKNLCGRFGGDEFLILLPDITRGELIALLDRLIVKMKETVRFPDPADTFSVSMGAVLYPLPGEDSGSLFKTADAALYEVKTTGKNGWKIAWDTRRSL